MTSIVFDFDEIRRQRDLLGTRLELQDSKSSETCHVKFNNVENFNFRSYPVPCAFESPIMGIPAWAPEQIRLFQEYVDNILKLYK